MKHHSLKFAFFGLFVFSVGSQPVLAETTSEIRNNKRTMASGESTVFAQGEGQSGTNSSWRGGLGVNFPSGSSVRLLVAQRPVMERIKPGEKVTTTAATTSSGGYNAAPVTTDAEGNTVQIVPGACTYTLSGPYISVKAKYTVDTSTLDVTSLPSSYFAEKRNGLIFTDTDITNYTFSSVSSESTEYECNATAGTSVTCGIQARIYFSNPVNPKTVAQTSVKSCTCTTSGCNWN